MAQRAVRHHARAGADGTRDGAGLPLVFAGFTVTTR